MRLKTFVILRIRRLEILEVDMDFQSKLLLICFSFLNLNFSTQKLKKKTNVTVRQSDNVKGYDITE